MEIYDLLVKKREELLSVGDVNNLLFSVEEIELLKDKDHLRLLKITHTFYSDFVPATDKQDCALRVFCGDDDIYRMLELCMLSNRAVRDSILSVFGELEDE